MSKEKRSKKSNYQPKILDPTPEEIRRATDMLKPFYINNLDKLGDLSVENKINEVIDRAKTGYRYCPKTFIGRVRAISKVNAGMQKANWGHAQNYHNVRESLIQKNLDAKQGGLYPGLSAKDLRLALPTEERKRWVERESFYRKEFELNNASDVPLLMQTLTEEIIQHRLIIQKLSNQDSNLDRQMNESYARLNKALENLGVTRRQRQSLRSETEGNIASLTEIIEKKQAKIDAIRERDLQEERSLKEMRNNPEVLLQMPPELREITEKAMSNEDW